MPGWSLFTTSKNMTMNINAAMVVNSSGVVAGMGANIVNTAAVAVSAMANAAAETESPEGTDIVVVTFEKICKTFHNILRHRETFQKIAVLLVVAKLVAK